VNKVVDIGLYTQHQKLPIAETFDVDRHLNGVATMEQNERHDVPQSSRVPGELFSQSLLIPRWFLLLASAVFVPLLPWGVWVSSTLFEMRALLSTSVMVREIATEIDHRLDTHLQDPKVHTGALNALETRLRIAEEELREVRTQLFRLLTDTVTTPKKSGFSSRTK
jgi:hypothetical protein